MLNTCSKFFLGVANIIKNVDQMAGQDGLFLRPTIRQCPICVSPDSLIRVDFRRIGRKTIKMQSGMAGEKFPNRFSAMGPTVVPNNDDVAMKMAQKVAKKFAGLGLLNIFGMPMVVESQMVALGTDGQSRNDRDLLSPVRMSMDRCFSTRRPCPEQRGNQKEPRFVYENEVGPQPTGFFLMRGHFSLIHRSILASSLCVARRSGFWQLHPHLAISRPMWSRWYFTPKCFSMTSAIRCVVQMSVRYPCDMAPWRSSLSRRRRWDLLSRGGRPAVGLTFSPASPCLRYSRHHRRTELAKHPIRRATAFRDNPFRTKSTARWRRASNTFAVPIGRMMDTSLSRRPLLHYLCRSQ